MSEVNMEAAKAVYQSACAVLEDLNIRHSRRDDDLVVTFAHRGNDMDHSLLLGVNAKKEAIQIVEKLPFKISVEKARDVASAVCLINKRLLIGSFTYDLGETLRFEVNQIYSGSVVGKETIQKMILALAVTVEEYDDKLMALNKGYLKVDDFKKKD